MTDDPRPQLPDKPAPDECCGGGCAPCILETYEDERSEYHGRMIGWYGRNPPLQQALEEAPGRPRLVLDTNVSLDLFVFRDPRCPALLKMLRSGECEAVMDVDCRQEFLRVLAYPQLKLSPLRRLNAIEAFDALYRFVGAVELPEAADARLPTCADPDDQKFLKLALQSQADVLLSRDNAVLELAGRTQGNGLFSITSPQDWLTQNTPQ